MSENPTLKKDETVIQHFRRNIDEHTERGIAPMPEKYRKARVSLLEEMTMHTLFHCHPSEFCCSQQETGGIYMDGKFTPIKILCIATHCRYPGKQCLYVKNGGKRPQDGE